ncbi:DEAD/DEAH box helicase [Myxococcus sp. AB056]|uniref:DEAD/DEAH box helicase n=1 Tax=Myxococcus sp. AB056 TaxID=2562792 RepID=UPI0011466F08|nr:DEAD/DEAH box helicase [Myxococcus sp. AB056]
MSEQVELGVNEIAQRIHLRLRRYLEAQYHIRNSAIIEERRILLEEPGGISQRPFIEVTPSYAVTGSFSGLSAPKPVTGLLQELVSWKRGIGVYPPYRHQADALEHFFAKGAQSDDLVVATGTGSGKTETFLYAILGALALEGTERRESFARHGVRALLLYPMNALVSDQTARLRRLLGDERLASLMEERWGRRTRFGMYTSRTPYPGMRKGAKDKRHLDRLVGYYEQLETSTKPEERDLVAKLKERGRWPAKDVVAFYARALEEKAIVKSGKRAGRENTLHHWGARFLTQPGDRELLTRHEMQEQAPDLLITNYSMLEYMLLRPIERPLFEQTRAWLSADPRNQFHLILDEAHMYRGVGGAEVGLLIRRLLSRLGVGRDRLRCILTTASLPDQGAATDEAAKKFARDLTGETGKRSFAIVRGTREKRSGARPGTLDEASALAAVNPAALAAAGVAPDEANASLASVAARLGWATPPTIVEKGDSATLPTRQYICRSLTGFGPLELLLEHASGNGTDFAVLAQMLFPGSSLGEAERATDGLLALGTFARRTEPGRNEQPLLPTRVHVLFRGLPPLYSCINPNCSARRNGTGTTLLGRLYTQPRTQCECGGRVFELLTHRDCGAAYLRAFATSATADFLWHERGGKLTEFGRPLHELHLFLEEPHPEQRGAVEPLLLDVQTGRVLGTASATTSGTRLCFRAHVAAVKVTNTTTFSVCPACTRTTQSNGSLKIMDLATKGEQPFANLVREQFVSQLATKGPSEQHPNEGRKALLFSDGRQKAARLARDLPREVERDSFREALVLACQELAQLSTPQPAILDETMYAAFVAVCARHHLHFFDGRDQDKLLEECRQFRKDFDDLDTALADKWRPTPPTRFRTALVRQIGDPYYSLVAACAAVVEAAPATLRKLQKRLTGVGTSSMIDEVANAWLREMFRMYAFDPALGKDARLDEFPFFQPVRAADGLKKFFELIRVRTGLSAADVERLRDELFEVFTREASAGDDSGRLVMTDSIVMCLALDAEWLQCTVCGHLQLKPFLGVCGNCQDKRLEKRPPEHEYMRSRKGFFREPLRAVLKGARPVHITAEEHTAQLSQRDAGDVYATTEEFELRFQDVPLGPDKPPVDILSCTTTMEVGIDIGSLTAVGLRTVPPQRENYQQRAGRAGRRGTSVSSVLMFAQGGAHDAHYFANPQAIISGPPREPRLKADNPRLARRHVNSHLLQTFFHSRLDSLSAEAQAEIAKHRPGIMSAFGDAKEFFEGTAEFSFGEFEQWMKREVLTPKSAIVEEVAGWLPAAIFKTEGADEKRKFVREIADTLLHTLTQLRDGRLGASSGEAVPSEEDANDDDTGGLLDLCFERGLLPSYAFPTDLCSFVIQEWDKSTLQWRIKVAERPQLAKAQALSEYAPGRLLVVNKQTYRVGGVFVDGPPSATPAAALFAQPLNRYVGCPQCSYISIEGGRASARTVEGSPCPVCRTPLFVREYLDPPGFSPEEGRALREGDREQDVTYASSAQLPEIASRDEFDWRDGPGVNFSHAYGEDVLLVVANKGKDAAGFSVCASCGGAWIDGDEPDGSHARPFLVPRHILERDGAGRACNGEVRRGLFLVHDFRTDLLLLRGAFRQPLDFQPKQPWLYDALATLAEALALGASLHLDIDPGELSAGFRLLPKLVDGDQGVAELYLFDTAAGGAGYAADAGEQLQQVLDRTEELLRVCPGNCERSCTKCLRHYGNRFLHGRLDRRLAYQLLRYFRAGEVPPFASVTEQIRKLRPLARFLEMEGWTTVADPSGALRCEGPRSMTVGIYPAFLASDAAEMTHPTVAPGDAPRVILPDYLVEHDLPSAYQRATGLTRPSTSAPRPTAPTPATGRIVELPIKDLRRADDDKTHGKVRVLVDVALAAGAFAVRVPSPGLRNIGFGAGGWLVVRPVSPGDLGPDTWIVVLRPRGKFGATGSEWTVAHVKALLGDEGAPSRLQVSYGSATGREYRPERLERTEVTLAAAIVCHADEAP